MPTDSRRAFWTLFVLVMCVAVAIQSYGIATWPMADDEVCSLVEMGRLHIGAEQFFSVPPEQIATLPKITPVWNAFQRTAIAMLPASEVSYRIPSLICGLLTTGLLFLVAARWRGLWFASALMIVLLSSQPFIFLQQIDRFYALTLLLLSLAGVTMWLPWGGNRLSLVTSVLAVLTVLSHNVTVAVFGLAFGASALLWMLGRAPLLLVWRTAAAAIPSALLYLVYLRPLVRGWRSTGNPTPVLTSFAAQASLPLLALALFGAWLALRKGQPLMLWCAVILGTSLAMFQVTAGSMTWSPRYFLFFLPFAWLLAADALTFVADRIGRGATGVVWYGLAILPLLPGLLSHFADGSRHDYRQAAAVVSARATAGDPILSDDAETLTYYLPPELRTSLEVRTRVTTPPSRAFYLIARANAWMPQPRYPGRHLELLAEISRRRVDPFSHILRIYHVDAAR